MNGLVPLGALVLTVGCATPPASPQDSSVVEAKVPTPKPPPRRRAPLAAAFVPTPGPDTIWGVNVPIACKPFHAFTTWFEYRCRVSETVMERFYRFRFPAAKIRQNGTAVIVEPQIGVAGYARIQPFDHDGFKARVLIYRGRFAGTDPGAEGVRRMMDPKARKLARTGVFDESTIKPRSRR